MYMRCFLEFTFADIRLISLEQVNYYTHFPQAESVVLCVIVGTPDVVDGIEDDGEDGGYSHEPAEHLGPRWHYVVAD